MQKLSAIISFQRLQGLNQKFWNDSLFQTLISTVWEMKSLLMTSHHSDWSSSSGGKSSSWWKWEDKDALCEKDIVEYQWSYWPLAISALTHYPGHNLALLGMLIFKIEKNHAYKTKFDICKTGNWIISNQAFFNTCMHKLLCLSSVRKKPQRICIMVSKGRKPLHFTSSLLLFDKPGPPNKVQFPLESYKAFLVISVFLFNTISLKWSQFQNSP